ncbi:magnesium chelatase, partial [Streptosporangium algeriense]
LTGEERAVTQVADLPGIVHALRGKVEFEVSEEGRETEVLSHLLRRAVAETFRGTIGGLDMAPLLERFSEGVQVESGTMVPAADLLRGIGPVPGLAKIMSGLGIGDESPGHAAAALEFALEGLYLLRRLSKDEVDGATVYRT